MRAQTREGAELVASMLGENVKAPAARRGLTAGIDAADLAFVAGFVLAFAGAALFWLPGALFVAGVALMVICWRLA